MSAAQEKYLAIPKGMPVARHRPSPTVAIPAGIDELPLIDGKTPGDRQIQNHWIAQVQVFDLGDPDQLKDYTAVWQQVSDGKAQMCEHRTEFNDGKFVALLRWADFDYKLPTQPG